MSEYAKNIQKIEDMWKKRIELREQGGGRMSEYIYCSNGEPLANERGKILLARAGEVVRCRDCVHYKPYRTNRHGMMNRCHDEQGHTHRRDESDFCSRGERRSE